MTAVVDRPAPPAVRSPVRPPGTPSPAREVRAALVVGVLALVARLVAITRAYELFVDEITYATISRNLAGGAGLTLYGQPFTLHPPALLGLDAVLIDVLGIHGSLDHVAMSLRPVSAVFGSLGCVGAYLLVSRVAGRRAAILVGLVLALDPFTVSYDSQVMLEAPAGAAALAVFGLVVAAIHRPPGRARQATVAAAGVMTAVVVTTKDTFGLVVAGALVVLTVTGWGLRRRETLAVLAGGVAGYAAYLAALASIGDLGSWWRSNVDGLLRLVGAHQETGFNAPTVHVTLLSRAFADLSGAASSYLVLAFGPVAVVVVAYAERPWQRDWRDRAGPGSQATVVVAVWAAAAAAYLAYATLFGSIEEQMYYILLAPSLCAIALAARTVWGGVRPRLRVAGALAVAATLIYSGVVWTHVHVTADDGYNRFLAWEATHLPQGTTMSVTEGSAQFLLHGFVLGDWDTLPELRAHDVQWVLVSVRLVDQGYTASPAFLRLLERHARLLYSSSQPIGLRLYDVRSLTGAP